MTTLKISEGGRIVDIDSGSHIGTLHIDDCGYYFRKNPLINKLSIDEEIQIRYILDELNNGGED